MFLKGEGGGHKIMDACCLFKRRQINSPPKQKVGGSQTFFLFGGCLVPLSPYLEELPMNTTIFISKEADAYLFSLEPHPTLIQRGGILAYYTCLLIFLWDHAQL